jgi:hypothetical protein
VAIVGWVRNHTHPSGLIASLIIPATGPRSSPAEPLAGSAAEGSRDELALVDGVAGEIGAFGKA